MRGSEEKGGSEEREGRRRGRVEGERGSREREGRERGRVGGEGELEEEEGWRRRRVEELSLLLKSFYASRLLEEDFKQGDTDICLQVIP